MFDFGFSEIVLTSAIALIVLGPEKLPKVARQVGNWMGRARSMARQLTDQLEREVIAEDLMKQSRPSATANPAAHAGSAAPGTSSTPAPYDSAYAPPSGTHPAGLASPASLASPTGTAPSPAEPTYSAHPSSPPHGADWHPAPPDTKSSDG